MDPELQPLLNPVANARCRRFRPLTYEEILDSRQEATWRRTRFFLIVMFWAIMAMFISIIVCILVQAPSCNMYDADFGPSVPPVHLTFAPLVSRVMNNQEFRSQREVLDSGEVYQIS